MMIHKFIINFSNIIKCLLTHTITGRISIIERLSIFRNHQIAIQTKIFLILQISIKVNVFFSYIISVPSEIIIILKPLYTSTSIIV